MCDTFPDDQIFSVAIELHITVSVMAQTWRKFVLLLHELMLQLPDQIIISNLYMLSK